MIFFQTSSAVAPVTMLVAEMAPGIDQRVHLRRAGADDGLHAFDRDDRVEAGAGRVDADPLLDRLEPLLLDDLRHREDLRDRLDRDLGLDVAGGVDLAVGRHQRDAEQVRIDLGQRRNVVGVLAFLQRLELVVRASTACWMSVARLRAQAEPCAQPDNGCASEKRSCRVVIVVILRASTRSCI